MAAASVLSSDYSFILQVKVDNKTKGSQNKSSSNDSMTATLCISWSNYSESGIFPQILEKY